MMSNTTHTPSGINYFKMKVEDTVSTDIKMLDKPVVIDPAPKKIVINKITQWSRPH